MMVFPSLLVVSSSIGYFRRTVTNRTLSPSVAAKILPFKRTVAVAAPYPAASRIPFGRLSCLGFRDLLRNEATVVAAGCLTSS